MALTKDNLIVITIDIDDNIRLVRCFHGIHLLVIIGPHPKVK